MITSIPYLNDPSFLINAARKNASSIDPGQRVKGGGEKKLYSQTSKTPAPSPTVGKIRKNCDIRQNFKRY